MLPALWGEVSAVRDPLYVDCMAKEMMEMYQREGNNIRVFTALPGVTEEKLEWMRERLGNVSTFRGAKRCFRLFITVQ